MIEAIRWVDRKTIKESEGTTEFIRVLQFYDGTDWIDVPAVEQTINL